MWDNSINYLDYIIIMILINEQLNENLLFYNIEK